MLIFARADGAPTPTMSLLSLSAPLRPPRPCVASRRTRCLEAHTNYHGLLISFLDVGMMPPPRITEILEGNTHGAKGPMTRRKYKAPPHFSGCLFVLPAVIGPLFISLDTHGRQALMFRLRWLAAE